VLTGRVLLDRYRIGEVRWAQGDRAGAIAAYQRFLELNTNPRQRQVAEERLREMRVSEPGADARAFRPRPRIRPV
jgi:predicted TPR repeat methyltransferase